MLITSAQSRNYYRGLALADSVTKAVRTAQGIRVVRTLDTGSELIVGDHDELNDILAGLRAGKAETVNLLDR